IFLRRTREEWTRLFLEHDIAGGPVNSVDELVRDPHFTARKNTYTVKCDKAGEMELLVSPVRVPGEEFAPAPAPELGADTYEVLTEVAGYDEATAAELSGTDAVAPQ